MRKIDAVDHEGLRKSPKRRFKILDRVGSERINGKKNEYS